MVKLFSTRLWRTIIPLGLFAATLILLARTEYPLPPDAAGLLWITRLDPLLLLAEWRITGILPAWCWLPLGIVVLTLLLGRVFCGWLCPVGGLLAQIPVRRSQPRILLWWYENRYYWLIFVLVLLFLGSNWPLFLTPFHLLTEELTRLWQGKMSWLLAGMLLTGIVLFPRIWCVYVCPTGLLMALVSRWRLFRLTKGDNCSNCGMCDKVCRIQAIRMEKPGVTEDCGLCGRCWQVCRAGAISWRESDSIRQPEVLLKMLSRRQLLKGASATVVAGFTWRSLSPFTESAVLRPPGALPEADFLARCSRCGRCVKVCPSGALQPMSLETGIVAFLTPQVIARRAKCELCMLCAEVCPTKAIATVPLSEVKMGLAKIDRQRCLVWAKQIVCLLCREQCPLHAIVVDAAGRPYVNETLCVGCGACENGCPLEEAAIVVWPE